MLTVLIKRKRFHIVLILSQKIGQPKVVNEVAKHQYSISNFFNILENAACPLNNFSVSFKYLLWLSLERESSRRPVLFQIFSTAF